MEIEIPNNIIGAAAFFAVLIYPNQTDKSFKKRDQLIDSILYIGSRQEGFKPINMTGRKGYDCNNFSDVDLRTFERRLNSASQILVKKVFQSISWLQIHSITGIQMYKLWDNWKESGDDIGVRARKEVFTPFKPILHLAFAFATVGIDLLNKKNIPLDIIAACRACDYWLVDVVTDSYLKMKLFEINPQMKERRLFEPRLRLISDETIKIKIKV